MRVDFWKSALTLAGDHPLAICALVMFVGMPLVLGWMHEARILLDCAVPLIRHAKEECREWRQSLARLKEEIRAPKAGS